MADSQIDIKALLELAKLREEKPEDYKKLIATLEEVFTDFAKITNRVLEKLMRGD